MAGHWHSLITGVSVIISGEVHYDFVETRVLMKKLSQPSLRAYVKQDNPIDCAGAYKFEKGGPLLMERVETRDPSSIIGLPLIALTNIIFKQTGEITT